MDVRIDKTVRGYEVYINGKLYEIYRGSQDIRMLEQEVRTRHQQVYQQLEMLKHGRGFWRLLEAGMLPNSVLDALMVVLEASLRKNRS